MKSLLASLMLLILVASCATGPKPVVHMSESEINIELVHLSGVINNVDAVSLGIETTLSQKLKEQKLDPQVAQILKEAMVSNFNRETLLTPIVESMAKELSLQEKKDVLSFYRTPTGQHVAMMDNFINTDQGQDNFQQWLVWMSTEKKQLTKDEIDFARDVAVYSGAMHATMETMTAVTLGILSGINSTFPKAQQLKESDLQKQKEMIKEKLADQIAPIVVLTCHYSYSALKPENKKDFLTFLKTGPGRKYVRVTAGAISSSFGIAASKAGKDLLRGLASVEKK